jgi:hypothetical protein
MKTINHIHPPSLSPFTSTSHWYPLPTGPVLHSCPSLFKPLFIVQRGFAIIFHLWIYCTLISPTSSITLPYPFPSTPSGSTAFSVFQWVFFLPRCIWILETCSVCVVYIDTHTYTCMHTYVCLYDHACICVQVYLLNLSCTYERKHSTSVFLTLAYLIWHDLQFHPFTANDLISFFFMTD